MTSTARATRAFAAGAALAVILFAALPAQVAAQEDVGFGDSAWAPGYTDGFAFGGAGAEVAGVVDFDASNGARIAAIELYVDPVGGTPAGCESSQPAAPGHRPADRGQPAWYGETLLGEPPPPTTTPSQPSTTTTVPTTPTSSDPDPDLPPDPVPFRFSAVPRCNRTYDFDLWVVLDYDPSPTTNLQAYPVLRLEDVTISLDPPPVSSLEVTANADRSVTVRWQPPAGYATAGSNGASGSAAAGAPPDFLGYRIQRQLGSGPFERITDVDTVTLQYIDRSVTQTSGHYTYRVTPYRGGAGSGRTFTAASSSPTKGVDIAAAPPRTTIPGVSIGRPRSGATPTTEGEYIETGPTQTYPDREEGDENAVLPEDGNPFIGVDAAGAGVLVPFATALLLAVWAMHLRYLSRRASGPA